MTRQVSPEAAATAYIRGAKVLARIQRSDGSADWTEVGSLTLDRMHADRGHITYYIEDPTPGEAPAKWKETKKHMVRDPLKYTVIKDGDVFAQFTWESDAVAYYDGVKESAPGHTWELRFPEKDEKKQ